MTIEPINDIKWKEIFSENLHLDYCQLFSKDTSDQIYKNLEEEVEYFTGDLARVKVFGKWHNLPRKQSSYGDSGLTYKYSGVITPAQPWTPTLKIIRDLLYEKTGTYYNFVLVNRYKDGKDKMGEHKDDEKDLDPLIPIASMTFGCVRPFYFVHQDRKRKKREIDKVTIQLEHGSLLLMKSPTNKFWYHALPPRAREKETRINLTFRSIILSPNDSEDTKNINKKIKLH